MRLAIIILAIFTIPILANATTLNVPSQFPTIQDAIDAASEDDTVLVEPGTYVENINFQGKNITVTSKSGPELTTIDGGNPKNPDYGSVVTFPLGTTDKAVLDGFTITNGTGNLDPTYGYLGGGIHTDASPTIRNNRITKNSAKHGGGIICIDSQAVICDNTIEFNTAIVSGGSSGGISCIMGSPTIKNNHIVNNASQYGGGIRCLASNPTILENTISNNNGSLNGGGIHLFGSSPIIIGNTISGNHTGSDGGGICCVNMSSPIIQNNFFYQNSAHVGGGIGIRRDCDLTLTNNTFIQNTASFGGGIRCTINVNCTVNNAILWNNQASMGGPEISIDSKSFPSTLNISNSDVEGGQASVHVSPGCTLNWDLGMIDTDPLFLDPTNGDCHLTWLSPCINRGTNEDAPLEDFEGDPRPYMGTVDMGADEFIETHPLEADIFGISESTGGKVNFSLDGGMSNNGRTYIILGSITGTAPGFPLPGGKITMRLNWDLFTSLVLDQLNTPIFQNFTGALSNSGTTYAALDTFGPLPPGTAGLTLYFAYALKTPWNFVSNPVAIEIVP